MSDGFGCASPSLVSRLTWWSCDLPFATGDASVSAKKWPRLSGSGSIQYFAIDASGTTTSADLPTSTSACSKSLRRNLPRGDRKLASGSSPTAAPRSTAAGAAAAGAAAAAEDEPPPCAAASAAFVVASSAFVEASSDSRAAIFFKRAGASAFVAVAEVVERTSVIVGRRAQSSRHGGSWYTTHLA